MKIAFSLLGVFLIFATFYFLSPEEKKEKRDTPISKKAKNKTAKKKKDTKSKSAGKKRAEKKANNSAKGKGLSLLSWSKKLKVAPEKTTGYNRDEFPHWSDLDGNGCDTRKDVLREENLKPRGEQCFDDRGLWFSAYDGVKTKDSSSFDVDHMVPLAEAYASGAWRWSIKKREIYANDRFKASLIAVSASSNREKSDKDPAEWLPKRKSYLCSYIKNWISVKYRWRLSVDKRERKTLVKLAKRCQGKKYVFKRR
jgi:hypothetical protein